LASSTPKGVGHELLVAVGIGILGRSERPFPRPSKTRTRKWRAKYAICPFHSREWTTDHEGRKRIVVSPSPYRSQNTRTPLRSTNPSSSGIAGAGLLSELGGQFSISARCSAALRAPSVFDRLVVHLAANLLGDGLGDRVGRRVCVVHRRPAP